MSWCMLGSGSLTATKRSAGILAEKSDVTVNPNWFTDLGPWAINIQPLNMMSMKWDWHGSADELGLDTANFAIRRRVQEPNFCCGPLTLRARDTKIKQSQISFNLLV